HVPARAALNAVLHQRNPQRTRPPAPSTIANMLDVVERTISDPLTFHDQAFATNVLLDIPLDERAEAITDARTQAGERTGEAEVDPLSPTEATFRLPTRNGRLDVTIALTPTMPPRIQTFGVVAVDRSS